MVLTNYPELLRLAGDDAAELSLAVFSHRTTAPDDAPQHPGFGNSDRLCQLGTQVLQCAATQYYFRHPAMFTAEHIRERVGRIMMGHKIHDWLDFYDLKSRLIFGPELNKGELLGNDGEMSKYFCTYIGAAFYCNGCNKVENWIGNLLNASLDGVKVELEDAVVVPGQEGPSPPVYTPPPIPSNYPGPSSREESTEVLPLPPDVSNLPRSFIHETAMKNRVNISYSESSEGPSHNPTWTVRCLINQEERGRAVAPNKSVGKDLAARHAFVAMGWHQAGRN
ncbi:hypothetical protein NMY22_g1206 [Coprinellus aureogranulatus]|nr:hypothetical protein NMY22_g1206 [Coprinellus aureogranulatus]